MPDPEIVNLHFWLDFETSGLEIGRDRVLEVAWCFTDADLRMVTPLRQRLACIEPVGARTDVDGNLFDPQLRSDWLVPEFFDQRGAFGLVQEMHETSGLMADHLDADPAGVLTHARHFERLYLDDLRDAKCQFGSDRFQVIISGAGVSHMDVHMLADLLPGQFPLMPNPDGSSGMAYWHHDTSTAARCLPPGLMEKARNWLKDPECPFDLIACEKGSNRENVQDEVVRTKRVKGELMARGQTDLISEFNLDGVMRHRAASDVVESLVDARLMRRLDQVPDLLTSRY